MEDFVKKVLDGEVTDEELTAFKDKLSQEGKKELEASLAFRDKRKDEEGKSVAEAERLSKLKAEADAEEARLNTARGENSQFRTEQITKAKAKFFAEYKVPAEKQAEYEAEFGNLDSGKMDPDLIYKDFERTHVSLNSDVYLEAERKQRDMERSAGDFNANGAGTHHAAPGGNEPPKFSEIAKKIAHDSEISEEAAAKIESEGYSRTIA